MQDLQKYFLLKDRARGFPTTQLEGHSDSTSVINSRSSSSESPSSRSGTSVNITSSSLINCLSHFLWSSFTLFRFLFGLVSICFFWGGGWEEDAGLGKEAGLGSESLNASFLASSLARREEVRSGCLGGRELSDTGGWGSDSGFVGLFRDSQF